MDKTLDLSMNPAELEEKDIDCIANAKLKEILKNLIQQAKEQQDEPFEDKITIKFEKTLK
ncbi:hypothetical protein NMY3_02675 [Candidatus Nitrosocosmicus oleophilus]|uniref:Uncharacterized protein n=1 Tax=Candidatus Nitrosocosmicus oleophilus TaxID=1353260 RepID=A0A654M084_9ARCH|nr:hypothetical protein [Candidatus Nitrosocosmicus oleophilus]ALI36865.1 hypothetical protein NMY3_02675 [Candidatus Nitrosocosmicus oleophilus]